MDDTILVEDWFDPNNIKHVKAFGEYLNTNTFECEGAPEEMVFNIGWNFRIIRIMANKWVEYIDYFHELVKTRDIMEAQNDAMESMEG